MVNSSRSRRDPAYSEGRTPLFLRCKASTKRVSRLIAPMPSWMPSRIGGHCDGRRVRPRPVNWRQEAGDRRARRNSQDSRGEPRRLERLVSDRPGERFESPLVSAMSQAPYWKCRSSVVQASKPRSRSGSFPFSERGRRGPVRGCWIADKLLRQADFTAGPGRQAVASGPGGALRLRALERLSIIPRSASQFGGGNLALPLA